MYIITNVHSSNVYIQMLKCMSCSHRHVYIVCIFIYVYMHTTSLYICIHIHTCTHTQSLNFTHPFSPLLKFQIAKRIFSI